MTVPRLGVAVVALLASLSAIAWAVGHDPTATFTRVGRAAASEASPASPTGDGATTRSTTRSTTPLAGRPTGVQVDPPATVPASFGIWRFLAGPVEADADAFEAAWRDAFDTRAPSAALVAQLAATRLAATLRAHAGGIERLQWPASDLASSGRRAGEAGRTQAEALDGFATVITHQGVSRSVGAYLEVWRADDERRLRWSQTAAVLGA